MRIVTSGKLPDFVVNDADLTHRNTLALPAVARHYVHITNREKLTVLANNPAATRMRRFVLGGGSNLVLTSNFDGLLVHMAITGRGLLGEDADAWYVYAGAGENWHDFVQWTLAQGWPGLENLALIPGTVGASPVQNIGAYGLEMAERFHSLTVVDLLNGQSRCFDRKACHFGYRDSVFKQEGWHLDGRYAITDVTFRLPKAWNPLASYADVAAELEHRKIESPTATQIAEAVIAIRQCKLPDPKDIPNAGSFFRNPIVDPATVERLRAMYPDIPCYPEADGHFKLAAGWLIERAGWRGRDLGHAGMYEKQALVLVNRGKATGSDVTALMQAVQSDVRNKFALELMPEPVLLGP